MNKLLYTLLLVLLVIAVCGQDISKHDADSLLRSLDKSNSDTGRFNLLLKIARFHIFKPGEFKTDLDSAEVLINDAERLKTRIKSKEADGHILLVKSYLIKEKGEREMAKGMIENAIDILKKGKNKFLLGEACLELSYYFPYQNIGTTATKMHWIEQAVEAYQQSGNPERKAFCLTLLANVHIINNEDAKALQELKLALEVYDSIHHNKTQSVYVLMANLYYRSADYSNAIRYELMALKAAEMAHDSTMVLAQIDNEIGGLFVFQGENEKGISYYKNGLSIAEKYRDTISIFLFAMNIADVYVRLNKPLDALKIIKNISKKYGNPGNLFSEYLTAKTYINIYISQKLYTSAAPYCNKLLAMIKGPEFGLNEIAGVYSLVIRYYIASKQYSSARIYLIKNKELSRQLARPQEISRNYRQWFMLDSAQDNYKSALYNLIEYNKINDAVFNQSKSKQIGLLQVEYETEKKNNDIKMKEQEIQVLTQQDQLRRASLKKANFVRNVTFGGILMLLVITSLVYKQYRNKQKSNRDIMQSNEVITQKNQLITQKNELITQKNGQLEHLLTEKEWLIKEVHHRVKNNLQMVISLLNTQSAYLDNDAAIMAIQDSRRRMQTMSLIHQKLYQSENVSVIDMPVYINELVNYLKDIFSTGSGIRFEQDIAPIKLDVSQAVPVGLILNEVITNAIKYAFNGNENGIIAISMHHVHNQNLLLSIRDTGKGLPEDFDLSGNTSLGMSLVLGLVKQLEGSFELVNKEGVEIIIKFPYQTETIS
jgi:two-component sensor histidine kinase